jgi:hypothetical protein
MANKANICVKEHMKIYNMVDFGRTEYQGKGWEIGKERRLADEDTVHKIC